MGGNESIKTNLRIIAATNRNLEHRVIDGGFREDLLYRLNGFTINLPPLRHRPEDIVPLLEYFLRRARADMRKHDLYGIAPAALDRLLRYDWPGNVRQLQSVVRQSVLNTTGTVLGPVALPAFVSAIDAGTSQEPQHDRLTVNSMATTQPHHASSMNRIRDQDQMEQGDSSRFNGAQIFSLAEFIEERMQAGTHNLYDEVLEGMERYLLAPVLNAMGENQSTTAQILGITRGKVRDRIAAFDMQMDRTVKVGKD